jgi:GNAT superfamily N-acetyltransferase
VGAATIGHSMFAFHPRKFFVGVRVLREARRQGIGAALHAMAIEMVESERPISLTTRVRETDEDGVRFAAARGYEEKMREWESAIDMGAYDPQRFAHLREKASLAGIRIMSAQQLAAGGEPDWERKIHAAEMETLADVPSTDRFVPSEFEDWRRMALESKHFLPEGFFAALDGDRIVGTSALWLSSREGTLETGLTGVLRDYRRKGIALALKLTALEFAKRYGAREVRTDNATTNRPMLAINEMLGFEKRPATIFMVKAMEA